MQIKQFPCITVLLVFGNGFSSCNRPPVMSRVLLYTNKNGIYSASSVKTISLFTLSKFNSLCLALVLSLLNKILVLYAFIYVLSLLYKKIELVIKQSYLNFDRRKF